MATFSERLKIALVNKNMKQSVLAYRLGVDRSYISNYLSGKYSARPETITKMAKILEVSEAWLSGFDVPMVEQRENTDEIIPRDPELIEYLQMLKNRPEMKMLFSLAKDATVDDVKKAVAIIEALRKNSNE